MEKPQWSDDIDVDDILSTTAGPSGSRSQKEKTKKKKKKKRLTDEPAPDGVDVDAMDADAPEALDEKEWDGTEEMRRQKVQEYMDEVYGMDFNDMVCLTSFNDFSGFIGTLFRLEIYPHVSSTLLLCLNLTPLHLQRFCWRRTLSSTST